MAAFRHEDHVRAFDAQRQLPAFVELGEQSVDLVLVFQIAAVIERRDTMLAQDPERLGDDIARPHRPVAIHLRNGRSEAHGIGHQGGAKRRRRLRRLSCVERVGCSEQSSRRP